MKKFLVTYVRLSHRFFYIIISYWHIIFFFKKVTKKIIFSWTFRRCRIFHDVRVNIVFPLIGIELWIPFYNAKTCVRDKIDFLVTSLPLGIRCDPYRTVHISPYLRRNIHYIWIVTKHLADVHKTNLDQNILEKFFMSPIYVCAPLETSHKFGDIGCLR